MPRIPKIALRKSCDEFKATKNKKSGFVYKFFSILIIFNHVLGITTLRAHVFQNWICRANPSRIIPSRAPTVAMPSTVALSIWFEFHPKTHIKPINLRLMDVEEEAGEQ